jgi:hypothetical protein
MPGTPLITPGTPGIPTPGGHGRRVNDDRIPGRETRRRHTPGSPDRRRLRLGVAALVGGLLAGAFLPGDAAAQGTQFSVLGGVTYSDLRDVDGFDGRSGAMAGISLLLPLRGAFGFQPEALVVSRGAQAGSNLRESIDLNAFEIPLLLRVSLAPRSSFTPHLYAGPYLGIQIDCTVEGTSVGCDDRDDISTRSVDVGAIAGGGVTLGLGPLIFTGGLRYGFGLSPLAEIGDAEFRESARHGGFGLYAGAGLRFGGRGSR